MFEVIKQCLHAQNSQFVAKFDKTRLPHTSNSSTLTICNLTTHYAIDLQFLQRLFTALCNNRLKFESDSLLPH